MEVVGTGSGSDMVEGYGSHNGAFFKGSGACQSYRSEDVEAAASQSKTWYCWDRISYSYRLADSRIDSDGAMIYSTATIHKPKK
jgi:hypothetical protein